MDGTLDGPHVSFKRHLLGPWPRTFENHSEEARFN